MSDIYYTEDHEWVRLDGETATVGISEYAQEQLGDVVFVELPDEGREFAQGDEIAVVESVKAAAEVYAPVGGQVIEVNDLLTDAPETVNTDAESDGWFFRMTLSDPDEVERLMTESDYRDYLEGLA